VERSEGLEHRFSDEDVGEIIRLASRLDDQVTGATDPGLGLADVHRIAGELGISSEAVAKAISSHARGVRRERRRTRLRQAWRRTLQAHGLVFGTSMAGLAGLDLAMGSGFDFVQYPFFIWGTILAWHGGLTWLLGRSR